MAQDPVCCVEVTKSQPGNTADFEGDVYIFCSEDCLEEFQRSPRKYAAEARARKQGRVNIPIETRGGSQGEQKQGTASKVEGEAREMGEKVENWWHKLVGSARKHS